MILMRRPGRAASALFGGILAIILTAASPVQAKSLPVVELFTSQGCSSCPPADAYMGELAARKDILALTFPVDYWDYMGWKDTLAHPANAKRQKAYARLRGDRNVYTPQMVINGMSHVVGSRKDQVTETLSATNEKLAADKVDVSLVADKDTLSIMIGAAPRAGKSEKATVWLILYQKKAAVKIGRGENSGRAITYYNVVHEMTPAGMWTGTPLSIKLPKSDLIAQGYDGCAVLLQRDGGGVILGAARLDRWAM
jgi:hypothetical protein